MNKLISKKNKKNVTESQKVENFKKKYQKKTKQKNSKFCSPARINFNACSSVFKGSRDLPHA